MGDWKDALGKLTGDAVNSEPSQENCKVVERKKRVGVVYSTNPDFVYDDGEIKQTESVPMNRQKLHLRMERAGRGGKIVTIVGGFAGNDEELETICKMLKQKCGVGGTVKESEVIIQGDKRKQLEEILKKEGYKL